MRIAFVLSSFPVITETFIVNQMCALIDKGHSITILAHKKNEVSVLHESILKYNLLDKVVYWIPEPKSKWKRFSAALSFIFTEKKQYSLGRLWNAFNFFKYGKNALSFHNFYRSRWFLKKGAYDVVHCHFAQFGLQIAQLKRDGFLTSEKLVTSFHGVDIAPDKLASYRKNYAILFSQMDVITYNSEYTKKLIEQITNERDSLRLLPVGLDTNHFRKKANTPSSEKFHLLFCGRLVPFKGPDLAIEILRILLDKNHKVHLTIIGTGPLMDDICKQIEVHQLHSFVTLTGAISQEAIIELMDASDVFLLPGIHDDETGRAENQGLVIQEAQSMELPVVVSDAGGMKYGLIDTETGYVVKEKNRTEFVEKLEILIKDHALRKKMGSKGRDYVVKQFDSEVLCEKLLTYYDEVLN